MQCLGEALLLRVCRQKRKPYVKRKTNWFHVISEGMVPTGHALPARALASCAAGSPRAVGALGAHPGCRREQRPTLGVASLNLTSLVMQQGSRHLERWGAVDCRFPGRGYSGPWLSPGKMWEACVSCIMS